jgi:hypothetical protein
MTTIVTRNALSDAMDVEQEIDSPHVDLGPLLGADRPLRIGLDDLHELLQSGEPAFSLEYGDTSLTVRRQDGGMMATLEFKW